MIPSNMISPNLRNAMAEIDGASLANAENMTKVKDADGIPISVPNIFNPQDVHIGQFTSHKSLESIIVNAVERDTIIRIKEHMSTYFSRLIINKPKDQTIIQCLGEFSLAGLVIGNYYLHDTIEHIKDQEKKTAK